MDLLDHLDYRSVIRAWIDAAPRRSQEALARRVGVSRSLVAMILGAERDLALPQARAWAAALDLPDEDHGTFEALVRAEHGETLALRRAARMHLAALREHRRARRPDSDLAALLSRWYVPVLLELARCEGFRPDAAHLAPRLWPEVDRDELAEALDALRQAGLLTADSGSVATPRDLEDDALAQLARHYHRQQLEHAALAQDEQGADERHLGSLAVAIRRDDLPRLIEALHHAHLRVVEPYRADAPDTVVQVSVQLFARSTPGATDTPGD